MNRVDVNCLIGHWPYRKLYKATFDDLLKIHKKNEISYGYISSLNSIFYNDPFEGEKELHETIKGTNYKHIQTINPLLPCFIDDIKRAKEQFNIKGVKIYPGIHGYKLDNKHVYSLCEVLYKMKLPLFINIRMEDERLNYLISPDIPSTKEISCFIENNKRINIVLLTIKSGELRAIKDILNFFKNVWFDTSGLKDDLFIIKKMIDIFGTNKIIYGSLYPLFCMKSSLLTLTLEDIDEVIKEGILKENVAKLSEFV